MWVLIPQATRLGGCVVEVGVWRGGSAAIIASSLKNAGRNNPLILFDTFKGVVKASKLDSIYKNGEHSDVELQQVENFIESIEYPNVVIRKGIFPNEVDLTEAERRRGISLIHINVDTYQSARDIFFSVLDDLLIGGMIVFDDYGIWGCEGVTQFCNEIRNENLLMIHNLNGHAIFIKTKET